MRIVVLVLWALPAWATAYTAVGTNPFQLWGISSTWSPAGVPNTGDTVNIPDGITVTLNQVITIGTGLRQGSQNPIAVSLNNSGRLILAQGGVLISRGDIVYIAANCANTTNALLMQGGSTLEFDSSTAASPSITHYTFGPQGNNGCRGFWSAGTSTLRNTVLSNPAGGAGLFSMRNNTGSGGSFTAYYTDFSNIGDRSHPGWQVAYEYSGAHLIQWNVAYNTFTNCGSIASTNTVGIDDNGNFRHSYNVHSQSAAAQIFSGWSNVTVPGTGTREIRNNVFDVALSNSGRGFYPGGFTIWSNYFGGGGLLGGSDGWAAFQGNFYRVPDSSAGPMIFLKGNTADDVWLLDEPVSASPGGPAIYAGAATSMGGEIADHAGQIRTGVTAFWQTSTPGASGNYSLINTILLPNESGSTSWWLTGIMPQLNTGTMLTIEHNTAMVDGLLGGFGLFYWIPAVPGTSTGMLASYRSNILWNPTTTGGTYKLYSYSTAAAAPGAGDLDPCLPAMCDYNDGWNTFSDGGGYSNGGNGYADNFSSVPGQHDLSANPMFVDTTRNTATFDSAYLAYTEPAWSGTASYSTGNLVSNADPAIYGNATINYRYINSTYTGNGPSGHGSATCAGANPKPGDYTLLSRACWEWASLYHIRLAVAAGTLYDDQTIGAHGVDIIRTLIQWIRAGYSPTNTMLSGSAHDGTDMGAMPVIFPAPTSF